MSNLDLVKNVANAIVGISTTYTVAEIIKNNTNPETTTRKVEVAVASFAIGGLVARRTKNYTSTMIDEIADSYQELKAMFHKES